MFLHFLCSVGFQNKQRPFPWTSQSQSQSYVTTDCQSASLSWCQEPIWGTSQNFYNCQTVVVLLMRGSLSGERIYMWFKIAAGPRQRIYFLAKVPQDSWSYFYCLRFEAQSVWRFRSPYLYPPGTGWSSYAQFHTYLLKQHYAAVPCSGDVIILWSTNWIFMYHFEGIRSLNPMP
jgi:hypothetical protein